MLHRDLPLKLAAIGLAVFLWFRVTLSEPGPPRSAVTVLPGADPGMAAARTVPVVLRTEGALPPEVRLVAVTVEPPAVTLVGQPLRLRDIGRINTEVCDVRRVRESQTLRVRLAVPKGLEVPNLPDGRVAVTLSLEPREPGALPLDATGEQTAR